MTYTLPNLQSANGALRFTFLPERARLDGLGAYYPSTAQLFYSDGTPVDRTVKGLGDICSCPTCLRPRGIRGLGQSQISGQTIALSSVQIAGATAPLIFGAAAIPIIGAAVAGAAVAISLLWHAFNHDPRKNATTSIVNQIEPKLQENLAAYLAGPRTASSQAQALANFDAGWNLVLANCDRPEFGVTAGEPGYNCIHDRMQGACHWTKSGSTPGVPPDNCWNWFIGYRDPIASDPNVTADPGAELFSNSAASAAGTPSAPTGSSSAGAPNYLLWAGLLVGAAVMAGAN